MLIDYDPETGSLTWKERPRTRFHTNGTWARFNKHIAGTAALNGADTEGYKRGQIFEKDYKAHRVAWAIHYGEWPSGLLDHINGDPGDNRIANLRCVSAFENQQNTKRYRSNKSGQTGVSPTANGRKWQAQIKCDGRFIYLGTFRTFEAARDARLTAERELGFHPNHGRSS